MAVRGRKEKIKAAQEHLILEIEIGRKKFRFDPDLFELDSHNLGKLSDQISPIPAQIAYVGVALAEAERVLAEAEMKFDVWMAEATNAVRKKKETAKVAAKTVEQLIIERHSAEYQTGRNAVDEAAYTVGILKAYRNGMDAKHSLSQTISGNLRLEIEGLKGGRGL